MAACRSWGLEEATFIARVALAPLVKAAITKEMVLRQSVTDSNASLCLLLEPLKPSLYKPVLLLASLFLSTPQATKQLNLQ